MNSAIKIKADYIGHRQRILRKLNRYGYEQFADYEIIEMMLFLIFRRKDTKPLAKRLLERFKSLSGILKADMQSLLEVEGVGSAVCDGIRIINMLIKATSKSQLYTSPIIHCLSDVLNYAKTHMINLSHEEVRIIFLDNKNFVIDDRVIQQGSIDKVAIYPREIVKLCLQNGSNSFIIIHNHPSGDPTPSLNDQYVTNKIAEICKVLKINMLDHIIISKSQYTSFKALGLLDNTNINENEY